MMNLKRAEQLDLSPQGIFCGFALAGYLPDKMGADPVFAVLRQLQRVELKVDEGGTLILNAGLAFQVSYSRGKLGIRDELHNVSDCPFPVNHPSHFSGARTMGHALNQTKRRGSKFVVMTISIDDCQGAITLVEVG